MLFVSICIGMASSYSLSASPKKKKNTSKRKYQIAEKFLINRNYTKAAAIYKELLEQSSRNADLNFKLGLCYINMVSEKDKSVILLEKAIQYTSSRNNISMDVYFNLAKAYHANYQFRESIKVYKDLLQIISPQNTSFRNEIQREIKMCENGIELTKAPVDISIVNLGNKINTEFSEHSPGVTADESTMVFTSRRNGTGSKIDSDGQYFEDIYISHLINNSWTEPVGIAKLNTIDHDASISISADGQELYIYKADFLNSRESEGGDIYVSRLEGTEWGEPKKLAPVINSKSKESHISISADNRTIFFSSNRPGGYGGMDVYKVSKLPNGKWGRAKNLGPAINTEYDDDAPFIHPDGKTLYFSSSGHKTMGGLDVFKSVNSKGRWTTPINVGYPINSTDDDIYYTPTPDGKRAYFASYRKGSLGRTDIFLIKMPNEEKVGLFVLKGKVINTSGSAVLNCKITVNKNGKIIGIYKPNAASGKFLFIVDAGEKYDIEIVAEGYRTLRTVLNIPPEFANKENRSVITLLPLTLRTKDEPNYPQTLELIDLEKSKLNDIGSLPSKKDSIPDNKKFSELNSKKDTITSNTSLSIDQIIKNEVLKTNTVAKKDSIVKTDIELPKEKKNISKNTAVAKDKTISKQSEKQIKKSIPLTPDSKIKKLDSGESTFTIDLGNFTSPQPELLKLVDGVKETLEAGKRYHYTYGKFTDYKKAENAKERIRTKGFDAAKINILSNSNIEENNIDAENRASLNKDHNQLMKKAALVAPDSKIRKLDTNGATYTLDLGNFTSPQPKILKLIDGVKETLGADKRYHYTYGKFTDYKKAAKAKEAITAKGFDAAKINILSKGNIVKEITNESKSGSLTKDQNKFIKKSTLTSPDSQIKKLDTSDLAFTLDLGSFTTPKPELFDLLDGVKQTIGPDKKYHYTYGKFTDYKKAAKAKKTIVTKGFNTAKIRILSNNHIVKESSGAETYYTIQIMALHTSVESEFFDNLDNVEVFPCDDGFTRYTYKKFTSFQDAVTEMNRLIRMGYWDSFIRTVINNQLLYPGMKFSEKSTYTIQVMALRYPKAQSFFSDLGKVNVFSDVNGLYRYTYKVYRNKTEAIRDLGSVLKRGYWDAFVRKSLSGEHILDLNSNKTDHFYTIQVMALKNARLLDFFTNLDTNNLLIHEGKDGLSRYTFRKYSSLSEAQNQLPSVKNKGYLDAFTREIKWYNKH